jgi:hypothetical protein
MKRAEQSGVAASAEKLRVRREGEKGRAAARQAL